MPPKDATPPPKRPADSLSVSTSEAEALFDEALASMAPRGRGLIWEPLELAEAARLLPDYEILALLGRGGMGAVYQARQKSLDRTVALKLLPREISADQGFVDRFTREAHTLARLQHPNIVTAHNFDRTSEGHFYFVMEYVAGTDLARMMRDRALTQKEVLEIVASICDALHYAHQQGIVHRDIKPANVLVGEDGRVKVADFGLARSLAPVPGSHHTQTGTVIGTPAYMAPEQLTGASIDHRADVYGLGVMLYEMLCRELPRGAFPPPSKAASVDRRLDEVVSRAMRPQPADRYQSVAEMREAIARILARTAPVPAVRFLAWTAAAALGCLAIFATVRNWPGRVPKAAVSAPISLPPAPTPTPSPAPAPAIAPVPVSTATFDTATSENPYVNSLGMKFVPVPIAGGPSNGKRVLFSMWETRVQDFDAYATDVRRRWDRPPYPQEPTHPMATASWADAQAFCGWLTTRERASGRLYPNDIYRLPTDHEWSCAIGLGDREDPWQLPEEKGRLLPAVYPWGGSLPPPPGSENYSGEETAGQAVFISQPILAGYRDPFNATSPVGSLAPNRLGLYDLSGNVREWCDDWYDAKYQMHPQRGASFGSGTALELRSSYRAFGAAQGRSWHTGFRVVLTTTDMQIKRTLVAPPRESDEWVDWFAEQQRAGIVLPNFTKEDSGWKCRAGMSYPLFAPSLRDLTVRIRFRVGDRFDLPNVLFRRVTHGTVTSGYTGQIWKEGIARIVKMDGGKNNYLASSPVPGFDPAGEITLEFQASGDHFRLAVNDHELSATPPPDDAFQTGGCWIYVPPGSLVTSLEYRLPPQRSAARP